MGIIWGFGGLALPANRMRLVDTGLFQSEIVGRVSVLSAQGKNGPQTHCPFRFVMFWLVAIRPKDGINGIELALQGEFLGSFGRGDLRKFKEEFIDDFEFHVFLEGW